MTFLAAVVAFPLVLTVLSLGLGLGLDRAAGGRLPGLLLVPLGFAGLIVVSQLTTWAGAIAPATPVVLVVVAVVGLVLGLGRLRALRPDPWGAGAGLATYVAVAAPVLAAGRATFPAYLLDTTGAIQLAGAERIIEHGRGLGVLPDSSYGATLAGYFGHQYPSGSHTVLVGVGRLLGTDLVWLYAPLMAASLAYAALVLVFLAQRAGLPRPLAAAAGLVSAVPALVYAYALMGSIKEIVLLPSLLLLGACIVVARDEVGPRRLWVPLGVAGAAGLAAIGLAFAPWLVLCALAAIAARLLVRPGGLVRRAASEAVPLAVAVIVLALPIVASLAGSLRVASSLSSGNQAYASDPGNLLRPLLKVQALGVWLGGAHRTGPLYPGATYALIGVVAVGLALGVGWLVRRGRWELLAFGGICLVVWAGLTVRGTTWTDAKVLMLLSPVLLLAAAVGVGSLLERRRIEAVLLGAAIAFGVLGSDALSYHYTNLAPTARFDELHTVGQRFSGEGPTLAPDFDEYAFFELRTMDVDGPGNALKGHAGRLIGGRPEQYGSSYDLDALPNDEVQYYRTIVMRRSPSRSRPPANYREVFSGRYYEVWQRQPGAPRPVAHLPLGSRLEPAARPRCRDVRHLAVVARRAGGKLVAASAPLTVAEGAARLRHSPGFQQNRTLHVLVPLTPGSATATLHVPRAGRYRLWLVAQLGRALTASIDGRPAGRASEQTAGDGNAVAFGAVTLGAGPHRIRFVRGGGSLRPGDATASTISAVALQALPSTASLRAVTPGAYRSLCGRAADWIEAVP